MEDNYKEKYIAAMQRMKEATEDGMCSQTFAGGIFPELLETQEAWEDKIYRELMWYLFKRDYTSKVEKDATFEWLKRLEKVHRINDAKNAEEEKKVNNINVDDWIINNDKRIAKPVQILSLRGCGCLTTNGYLGFQHIKDNYHKWTIDDIVDGDILVTSGGNVFIYDANRFTNGLIYFYAGIGSRGNLIVKGPHSMLNHFGRLTDDIKPATKEQKQMLFDLLKEHCYEWDPNTNTLVFRTNWTNKNEH